MGFSCRAIVGEIESLNLIDLIFIGSFCGALFDKNGDIGGGFGLVSASLLLPPCCEGLCRIGSGIFLASHANFIPEDNATKLGYCKAINNRAWLEPDFFSSYFNTNPFACGRKRTHVDSLGGIGSTPRNDVVVAPNRTMQPTGGVILQHDCFGKSAILKKHICEKYAAFLNGDRWHVFANILSQACIGSANGFSTTKDFSFFSID